MAEAVKKLTVSYGAFSCTLEGFDDPFPVMKMVVDYFQSLAERDPSFGAHPERPDADYLRNLAQRGTNQNVEIETQENGVILRQTTETMPETVDAAAPLRGATLSLVPRTAQDNGDAVMVADYADEMFTSIERTDFPSEMQLAFQEPPHSDSQPSQNDPSSAYDREERALERLLNAARLRSGTEQTLAPANPMSQIKEALHEQMDSRLFDNAAPLEALPDSDFVTELVEPDVEIQMVGIGTLPISEPETPDAHQTEAETDPASALSLPETNDGAEELDEADAALAMTEAAAPIQEMAVEMPEISVVEDTLHAASDERTHDEVSPAIDEVVEIEEMFDSIPEQTVETTESESSTDVSLEMLADTTVIQSESRAGDDLVQAEDALVATTDDPVEFDWNGTKAEQTEASPSAAQDVTGDETDAIAAALSRTEFAEPVPMPLLVLGPALMIVSGDEAVLEDVQPTENQPEDQTEPQQSTDTRRQIVRARPEAVDFDYSAETRRAQPEPTFADEARHGAMSEDLDDAVDADDTGITLDNFARKVGAASLPELLEASAAYVTIVSGQPRFSRASILNMVDELSDERSYTQEARIKSFGKLLRNGSILRVEDGKFAISHSAKFNYEVKISA